MSQEIINSIGQLFITFLSTATGITCIFYLATWVMNFILSMIFPSRYGF